jgi:hypothetical protein
VRGARALMGRASWVIRCSRETRLRLIVAWRSAGIENRVVEVESIRKIVVWKFSRVEALIRDLPLTSAVEIKVSR